MKDTRKIIIGVVALAALLVVLRLTIFAPQPNDQKLIRAALEESLQASREGRPGGVLDILSSKFKINDQAPGSRWDIAKFIRDNKPEIDIQNKGAVISGDTASITTPVHIKLSFLNQTWDQKVDNVTLVFQKEEGSKFIVIPTREWHLTDVMVPDNAVPVNLPDMGGGGFGGFGAF